MTDDEMDRAHRADSEIEGACRDAMAALATVLASRRSGGRKRELEDAVRVCRDIRARIVATWD